MGGGGGNKSITISHIFFVVVVEYIMIKSADSGIRTREARAEDLKSYPFDHSGISVISHSWFALYVLDPVYVT